MNSKTVTTKQWILVVAGLLLIGKLTLNIWRIWKSGDRIQQAQVKLDRAVVEQETLKSRLAKVQTPEFVEKEAREKLGFGHPGEIIVIVPQTEPRSGKTEESRVSWQKWWDLYIGI